MPLVRLHNLQTVIEVYAHSNHFLLCGYDLGVWPHTPLFKVLHLETKLPLRIISHYLGAVPASELFKHHERVSNDRLEVAITKHSFMGLSSSKKKHILQTYYKFIMYRNPVERLLSAYRSKIEKKPLHGFGHDAPHYNWLKKDIFQYKHPNNYRKWKAAEGKSEIPISFSDFIDFWLYKGGLQFDEHFQTIYELCQPCYVRYQYYGNFDTFEKDAEVLINHIDSDSILLRDGYYDYSERTKYVAPDYYSQLSNKQKKLTIMRLSRDLLFYYTLFPSENDTHKTIMDCDFDIPTWD